MLTNNVELLIIVLISPQTPRQFWGTQNKEKCCCFFLRRHKRVAQQQVTLSGGNSPMVSEPNALMLSVLENVSHLLVWRQCKGSLFLLEVTGLFQSRDFFFCWNQQAGQFRVLSSVCACMLPYPRLTFTGFQGSNKQQEVNCKGEEAEIPLLPPTPPRAHRQPRITERAAGGC